MKNTVIIFKNNVTEKASLANKRNCHVFLVSSLANKLEVKREVARMFNVVVKGVNMASYQRKSKRVNMRNGNSSMRKQNTFKKAYVTLAPESKLNFG